jgi:hypothetical protein
MRVREIDPTFEAGALLAGAQFSDTYTITIGNSALDARRSAEKMLARGPRWVDALLVLRNLLVAPFGLKTSVRPARRTSSDCFRCSARRRTGWLQALTTSTSTFGS